MLRTQYLLELSIVIQIGNHLKPRFWKISGGSRYPGIPLDTALLTMHRHETSVVYRSITKILIRNVCGLHFDWIPNFRLPLSQSILCSIETLVWAISSGCSEQLSTLTSENTSGPEITEKCCMQLAALPRRLKIFPLHQQWASKTCLAAYTMGEPHILFTFSLHSFVDSKYYMLCTS